MDLESSCEQDLLQLHNHSEVGKALCYTLLTLIPASPYCQAKLMFPSLCPHAVLLPAPTKYLEIDDNNNNDLLPNSGNAGPSAMGSLCRVLKCLR